MGEHLNEKGGLPYLSSHYYDSRLGRFLCADDILPNVRNPQALNPYFYVYNNPISFADPSGSQPEAPRYSEFPPLTPAPAPPSTTSKKGSWRFPVLDVHGRMPPPLSPPLLLDATSDPNEVETLRR
jgi:RHS repeat-associated protein